MKKINSKIKRKPRKIPKLDDGISHRMRELEQEKMILQGLYNYLNEEKISSDRFIATLSDRLKNPIVPIKAYVDMLLDGHFGDLNEKQKERLEIIRKSTLCLNERLSNELDDKK